VKAVERDYVPALGYHALTRFYDPVVAATTRERTFKTALVEQARIAPGMSVLDLACGTGTLTLMLAAAAGNVQVTGVDGDAAVLVSARAKASAAGVAIDFQQGLSEPLEFAHRQFDRVLSSLFFHHLDDTTKCATLAEIHRVLKPGGELHIADWGKAANPVMRLAFLGIQLLDGFRTTASSVAGNLPQMIVDSGFSDVKEARRFGTIFGTMSLYRAVKTGVK
jgi:ubiquinone/menaquinone biosynthesis C-methylase UbiE